VVRAQENEGFEAHAHFFLRNCNARPWRFTIFAEATFSPRFEKGCHMTLSRRLTLALLIFAAVLPAQRRVDPRYSFHRVIAVVPLVGSGTAQDPI
jgi:hypothetical protein